MIDRSRLTRDELMEINFALRDREAKIDRAMKRAGKNGVHYSDHWRLFVVRSLLAELAD